MQKLTRKLLLDLRDQGYNILRSDSLVDDNKQIYWPDKVDLEKFFDLDSDEIAQISIPLQEKALLVIEEAITYPEDSLENSYVQLN